MINRIRLFIILFSLFSLQIWGQKDFVFKSGESVSISYSGTEKVINTAIGLFCNDYELVFDAIAQERKDKGEIIVGTLDDNNLPKYIENDISIIKNKKQAFLIKIGLDGKLYIIGSDKYGAAYGVMELSRMIGVSPWKWWADCEPDKKKEIRLASSFMVAKWPDVEYRGIFINDEDWGINPWSWSNYDPTSKKGEIGVKTHERIFELLLRLRANLFWPAMHECTLPFYYTDGNKDIASKYGITIGTSHCEPMMRNTNGEWKNDGCGEYDYLNNSGNVKAFWEGRIREVSSYDNIYTLGMRGVHDGAMIGAKTIEEQKNVLTNVIKDQRALISKYVNKDITKVPQVFIPYKEVLDIYNAGLVVPNDVTLMWSDDNYGYIRHFPTKAERERAGGNGIYYHISYWGRPHDYLWLSTVSPSLIYQQMSLAYEKGIRKMWILNVGDIKPAEFQIEQFLEMAWSMDSFKKKGVSGFQHSFFEREYGKEIADSINPIMNEFYRLAYIRKPEFLGNTRTEEKDPIYSSIRDLSWNDEYIKNRLKEYTILSDKVERINRIIPKFKRKSFFQLIKYPVQSATQMNRKILIAQLARHGNANWKESDAAFDSISALTRIYNSNDKWKGIMDFQPRRLPVFDRVERKRTSYIKKREALYTLSGHECIKGEYTALENLGYEGKAVSVLKGNELIFLLPDIKSDSLGIEVRLMPNHPLSGNKLRFSLQLDNEKPYIFSYETKGRSEEWKENVLRNQAIRSINMKLHNSKCHYLKFKALDDGVVLDQFLLYGVIAVP